MAVDEIATRTFGKKYRDLDWLRGEEIDYESALARAVFDAARFTYPEMEALVELSEQEIATMAPPSEQFAHLSDDEFRALVLANEAEWVSK